MTTKRTPSKLNMWAQAHSGRVLFFGSLLALVAIWHTTVYVMFVNNGSDIAIWVAATVYVLATVFGFTLQAWYLYVRSRSPWWLMLNTLSPVVAVLVMIFLEDYSEGYV